MSPSLSLLLLGVITGLWLSSPVESVPSSNCTIPICGRDYNPVCGASQEERRSFLNECELHAYNCRAKKDLAVVDKNHVCPGDEKLFE